MYSEDDITAFWEVTRLKNNPAFSAAYLKALKTVLAVPVGDRFETPFSRKKKKSGTRTIVPAKGSLKFIHYILSRWIRRETKSYDFSFTPKGGLGAVAKHRLFTSAICLDLTSAFDQITAPAIKERFRSVLMSNKLADIFAELVTFNGKLPQGCVTSPYVFNAVFAPTDLMLLGLPRRFPDIVAVTRYVDDICISINNSSPQILENVTKAATGMLNKHGFHGRLTKYNVPPIDYLGVYIYPKRITLRTRKYEDIITKVVLARKSSDPAKLRRSITGYLNWATRVYGAFMPQELVDVFESYFKLVGPLPKKLIQLKSAKLL